LLSYEDVASGTAGSLSTTWQRRGGRAMSPPGAATLRVRLYNYMNSGWAAFDDVSLKEVTTTRYYHFNGQRVAMRQNDVVQYIVGDHPSVPQDRPGHDEPGHG
jgi:hypothetical protein